MSAEFHRIEWNQGYEEVFGMASIQAFPRGVMLASETDKLLFIMYSIRT